MKMRTLGIFGTFEVQVMLMPDRDRRRLWTPMDANNRGITRSSEEVTK
jgi:hypothetical protein